MNHIRLILDKDIPQLLGWVHALAAHHEDAASVTMDDLRRDFLGPHPWVRGLVASEYGYAALCPLAQVQFGARGMDIHHLFVAPHARGRGIGRALIKASIELARAEGCRFLTVGTHPDNRAAQEVYLQTGFERMSSAAPRFRMKW